MVFRCGGSNIVYWLAEHISGNGGGIWDKSLKIFQGTVEKFFDLIVGCELLRFLVEYKNGKVKTNTAHK